MTLSEAPEHTASWVNGSNTLVCIAATHQVSERTASFVYGCNTLVYVASIHTHSLLLPY